MPVLMAARTVVETARGWIGVPVAHQGLRKDTGCDCIGLLRGVGAELGLFPADPEDFWKLPGAERWKAYGREPVGTFLDALDTVFDRSGAIEAGGIVAMRFKARPRHCAIVGEHPAGGFTLIHSLYTGVIEQRLDKRREQNIVAFYRFRGVNYER